MITYLQNLSFWDWLALATLLLILEVFGAGGYLLWIGLATGHRQQGTTSDLRDS